MENIKGVVLEIYQILFILSLLFCLKIIIEISIKFYNIIKFNAEPKIMLDKKEAYLFWIFLAISISYLI